MAAKGRCPNPECKERLASVEVEEITVFAGEQQFAGISFVCSKCHAVISVEVNPWYSKGFAEGLEKPASDAS